MRIGPVDEILQICAAVYGYVWTNCESVCGEPTAWEMFWNLVRWLWVRDQRSTVSKHYYALDSSIVISSWILRSHRLIEREKEIPEVTVGSCSCWRFRRPKDAHLQPQIQYSQTVQRTSESQTHDLHRCIPCCGCVRI